MWLVIYLWNIESISKKSRFWIACVFFEHIFQNPCQLDFEEYFLRVLFYLLYHNPPKSNPLIYTLIFETNRKNKISTVQLPFIAFQP